MTGPETDEGHAGTPEPWPLHAKVVKTLLGLSPFGVVLGWGIVAIFALLLIAGPDAQNACQGFSCSPVLAFVFAIIVVVLPVVAVGIGLLGLMTILRLSLATRLWTAAVVPPIGFGLMVLFLS